MNQIREASIEDIEDLVALGEKSFEFGGLHEFYPYNHSIAREEFIAMIEKPERFLIVLDTNEGVKGMMAAVSFSAMCGQALATYEQYIFVDEAYRNGGTLKKFLTRYNEWGEEIGATMQFMVSHVDHDKFGRFYSLFGYKPSERTYIRKTKWQYSQE